MMGYVVVFLAAIALLGAVFTSTPSPTVDVMQKAHGELEQYKAFVSAADAYFNASTPPATTTSFSWTTIRSAGPSGHRSLQVPPYWKAVRGPSGEWVACTELREETMSLVGQLFPAQTATVGTGTVTIVPTPIPTSSVTAIVGSGGSSDPSVVPTYIVMGQAGAESAASANLCGQY